MSAVSNKMVDFAGECTETADCREFRLRDGLADAGRRKGRKAAPTDSHLALTGGAFLPKRRFRFQRKRLNKRADLKPGLEATPRPT